MLQHRPIPARAGCSAACRGIVVARLWASSCVPPPPRAAVAIRFQQGSAPAPAAEQQAAADADDGASRSSVSGGNPGGSASLHRLHAQVDDMVAKYAHLETRLDSLETTLLTLLRNIKARVRAPAASAGVGPAGEAADGGLPTALASGDVPEYEEGGGEEEEDEDGGSIFDLGKLQSGLTENINKGFMDSVKRLRDGLMSYEWQVHGKELAGRRGVAQFEQHCAEHDIDVSFDTLSQLYADPNNLDVLPNDKLKLLARSIIQQVMDDRYCSIYLECTHTAKEMAHTGLKDIIPDSAGKVGGVLKDILPLPGFIKR